MKTIILTRHAKSSWKTEGLTDFERPLNKRGVTDIPVMAGRLKEQGPIPQLFVTSTAQRALQTAEMLMTELGIDSENLTSTEALYEAAARTILDQIKLLPSEADSVLLVGHNPGISSTCAYLSKDADVQMSTLAMACMELDVEDWDDIYADCAQMRWYDYPKKHTGNT